MIRRVIFFDITAAILCAKHAQTPKLKSVLFLISAFLLTGCKGATAPFIYNNGNDEDQTHHECPRTSSSCAPNEPPRKTV